MNDSRTAINDRTATARRIIIAIDGHSSTGKSTLAKALAQKLGYTYVDTGAMYRAVALYCLQNNLVDVSGKVSAALAGLCADGKSIQIEFRTDGERSRTFLNGEDVEREIRSVAVAAAVSPVSAVPEVRQFLVAQQQLMGRNRGLVMDGRDIGTVVFPDAELKIFMTAAPEIRAERRFLELKAKGENVSFDEVLRNIEERDRLDSSREHSPLRKADDALLLDNSHMTPSEQLDWLYDRYTIVIR
jgi:cytidylate kinase